MSFIPPPPPPTTSTGPNKVKALPSNDDDDDSLLMTALNQWVECLNDEEKQKGNIVVLWKTTPTILQQGPQCGLVALAMAAQALNVQIDSDVIFQQAVDMGVTKQGEMFCSTAMSDLLNHFNLKNTVRDHGLEDVQSILRVLCEGKLLLVPYDADANHSPCLKGGHKAHWALIFGFLLLTPQPVDHFQPLPLSSATVYRVTSKENDSIELLLSQCHKFNVHLLAKQGKSKRPTVWSYTSLEDSNSNLLQVDPKRNNPLEYVLPPGNELSNLRHKIIIIG